MIIFSTVRGARGSDARDGRRAETRTRGRGIGFLADVRRMNVALTRAKRALWIVGRCDVLRNGSEGWARLVDDAERRDAVARDADSGALFDAVVPFETQARALRRLGGDARALGSRGATGDRTRDAFVGRWSAATVDSDGTGGVSRARSASDVYGDLDET